MMSGLIIVMRSYRSHHFFFQAEDGIRDYKVTGVQTCALPICHELFTFIESELIAARDSGLPATRSQSDNGRFTQGGADAILANMYVNAGVFTKEEIGRASCRERV